MWGRMVSSGGVRVTLPKMTFSGLMVLVTLGAAFKTRAPSLGDAGETLAATRPQAGLTPLRVLLPSPADALVVSGKVAPSVHAVSAVELPSHGLLAFWFGGSREGASDVSIYSSLLSPGAQTWSAPQVAVARRDASRDLGRPLRKLGNPVATMVESRLWLFYVSVSVGGWSGSAINVTWSDDFGETWAPSCRLVSSPFANISTLVKGPAIDLGNGHLALPVYHEMVTKFPQILRIDCSGEKPRVEGRTTIPGGEKTIQPWIVSCPGGGAVAFLRRTGDRQPFVHVSRTSDGGGIWSRPVPAGKLANPNASVAAVDLGGEDILLAFNDTDSGRDDLSLAVTGDGGVSWQLIGSVENESRRPEEKGEKRLEYSYPWLLRTEAGEIHLFYTWNRRQIRHLKIPTQKREAEAGRKEP